MNIFEKGTIIPLCPKCEACPEQKECENQSKNNNTFLMICLIISAIANVGLIIGLIITLKKIK